MTNTIFQLMKIICKSTRTSEFTFDPGCFPSELVGHYAPPANTIAQYREPPKNMTIGKALLAGVLVH